MKAKFKPSSEGTLTLKLSRAEASSLAASIRQPGVLIDSLLQSLLRALKTAELPVEPSELSPTYPPVGVLRVTDIHGHVWAWSPSGNWVTEDTLNGRGWGPCVRAVSWQDLWRLYGPLKPSTASDEQPVLPRPARTFAGPVEPPGVDFVEDKNGVIWTKKSFGGWLCAENQQREFPLSWIQLRAALGPLTERFSR